MTEFSITIPLGQPVPMPGHFDVPVLGKGVVAMYKGDKPPTRLPKVIIDNKVPVVPWNQKELSGAIKTQAEKR